MTYELSDIRSASYILDAYFRHRPRRCRSHREKVFWKRIYKNVKSQERTTKE